MNATELAQAMLKWEELQRQAKELEESICQAVLELGKTQTVGNVRATFSNPRKSYNYEAAWNSDANPNKDKIVEYQKISYDYTKACKDYGIKDIPSTTTGTASVSLKLQA